MDNKYKNGRIYTIRYKNDDSLIYVGSTVTPLYKRFSDHKSHSKNPKNENKQLYKKMNETDLNDWYIELYEDCPCDRKEQLTQREGQVIREIGTLNKQIAGRSNKEWREENKDKLIEKHKEYYEENKDKLKEKKKEYYKENKEKIKSLAGEIVTCECGCSSRKYNLERHKRSLKHEKIIKELAKTLE